MKKFTENTDNKKVINATKVEYDGIKFRSKIEEKVYRKLISLGYKPEYELQPVKLWEGFRPSKPFYIEGEPEITKKNKLPRLLEDWNYTPDFMLKIDKFTFYIEAKGHPNDLWPYKRKLFLKWLETQDYSFFFQVKTIKGLMKSLEVMEYLHKCSELIKD